jgi:hypothetical protein
VRIPQDVHLPKETKKDKENAKTKISEEEPKENEKSQTQATRFQGHTAISQTH